MEDIKPAARSKIITTIRNVFPGKVFTKSEQQKIAAQISKQLSLHNDPKTPRPGDMRQNTML